MHRRGKSVENKLPDRTASLLAISLVVGDLARMRNEKRRRVYECHWAHFAAEIHLSVLFEC